MAIVIRLSRTGRKNRAHYRVGVYDDRTRRDGAPIEYLGHYHPLVDGDDNVTLQAERVSYWLGQGARVSETVRSFFAKKGVEVPKTSRARQARRGKKRKAPAA